MFLPEASSRTDLWWKECKCTVTLVAGMWQCHPHYSEPEWAWTSTSGADFREPAKGYVAHWERTPQISIVNFLPCTYFAHRAHALRALAGGWYHTRCVLSTLHSVCAGIIITHDYIYQQLQDPVSVLALWNTDSSPVLDQLLNCITYLPFFVDV